MRTPYKHEQIKTLDSIADDYINDHIKETASQVKLDNRFITSLIPHVIYHIEKTFHSYQGTEKYKMLQSILTKIVNTYVDDEQDKQYILKFLNSEELKYMVKTIVYIGNDLHTFVDKTNKFCCSSKSKKTKKENKK